MLFPSGIVHSGNPMCVGRGTIDSQFARLLVMYVPIFLLLLHYFD